MTLSMVARPIFIGMLLQAASAPSAPSDLAQLRGSDAESLKLLALGMAQMNLDMLAEAENSYYKSILLDLQHGVSKDDVHEAMLLRQKVSLYGEVLMWQNKTSTARDIYKAMVVAGHLDSELERPMVSFYDKRVAGRDSAWFYNEEIAERFPALDKMRRMLEENAAVMREEYVAYRTAYPELVQTHPDALVAKPREGWAQLPLASGKDDGSVANCRGLCPRTAEILQLIQVHLCSGEVCPRRAEYSILRPGTELRPHSGPTNLSITLHFGILVPEGQFLFCLGNGECRSWREGELFVFNEAFEHWATSVPDSATQSGPFGDRAVLLFKIPHPGIPREVYKKHYEYYLGNSSLLLQARNLGEEILLEEARRTGRISEL